MALLGYLVAKVREEKLSELWEQGVDQVPEVPLDLQGMLGLLVNLGTMVKQVHRVIPVQLA